MAVTSEPISAYAHARSQMAGRGCGLVRLPPRPLELVASSRRNLGGGVGMWLRAAGHARRSSLLGPAAQGGDETSGMGCLHSSSPAVAPMIDAAGPNARRGITPAREIPPKAPGP